MAANQFTIYPKLPDVGFQAVSVSDASRTGTPITNSLFPIQAAADGSRVDRLMIAPIATCSQPGILKVFINNGGNWSTSSNNILYKEVELPVVSSLATAHSIEELLNLALPPNYRLGILIECSAPFQWAVTAEGGIY